MTVLLLLVAVFTVLAAYNVYRPRFAPGRWAVVSFFAGWLVGELALHFVALQALFVAGLYVYGKVQGTWAWLALFGLVGSWLALLKAYANAHQAHQVVELALHETFGPDYRQQVPPPLRERWAEQVNWKKIWLPFPIRDPEVVCTADIVYRRATGLNLRLDVYRRRDRPARCPVLVQIHGGGWVIGSKNEQGLPLMYEMARQGWVCASVDYRLSPHATFPDHLVDVKAALVWLRQHAEQYGIDPNFVVVTGGSAGGHLAALVALTPNEPAYQPGFEAADTAVQGAVLMYGVYDLVDRFRTFRNPDIHHLLETKVFKASLEEAPELYERASPIALVGPQAPPMCIVHGNLDSLVPVEQARHFVSALRAVSRQPVVYAEIPGAQHAFDLFPSLRCQHVIHGIARFLSVIYSAYLVQRQAEERPAGSAQAEGHEGQRASSRGG